jgi:flagellar biosynthetic protein FlhB
MAQESGQERTEQPTARRLSEARAEGRVPRSQELSAAVTLLVGAALLGAAGGRALTDFAGQFFRESMQALTSDALGAEGAVFMLRHLTTGLLRAVLPVTLGIAAMLIVVNLAQTKGLVTWKPIQPKFNWLDPVAGLKRVVAPETWFNLLKSLVKITILGLITWSVVRGAWPELVSLAETGPAAVGEVLRAISVRLVLVVGLAFLALSLVDYAWVRWRYVSGLRMTKQEVVYENRDTEGDPMVKARQRSLAIQRARQRMLQAVPKADVVVVNPTHIAVALRYDPSEAPAPVVVALGERKLAERIKALARRHHVPVIENRPVARALLATATVGKPIPPALYIAVAEILAFVFRMRAMRDRGPERLGAGRTA